MKDLFKGVKLNLTMILILLLLGSIGFSVYQGYRINNLKTANIVLTEKERIQRNNVKVLSEEAKYWKTKDSINVVTVGLLNADKEQMKNEFADLDKKFNNLINDNKKKVERIAYLETQVKTKDSVIIKLKADKPAPGGSYIKNDSTIIVYDSVAHDSRNWKVLKGSILLGIDSNKIKEATINLTSEQSMGIDLALFKDSQGIDRVSVGTKYPNAKISVSGIVDVEKRLSDYKKLADAKKKKSILGLGFQVGYGFYVKGNTVYRTPYAGVGLNINLIRLK
jgi:hypothetical protein